MDRLHLLIAITASKILRPLESFLGFYRKFVKTRRHVGLETGNWKIETGKSKVETGNWKIETRNWKIELSSFETGDSTKFLPFR
jgi:hypothetical protein